MVATFLKVGNLLGIQLGVRVPGRSCTFDSWSNEVGTDSFFYFLAGVAQVVGEECLGALCFFADVVDMGVEVQFRVYVNSQVFSRVGDLLDMTMDGV